MFKKKETQGFSKFSIRLFVISSVLFVFSNVYISSYELALNIEMQMKEKEINCLESDIDGLNIKKQELASFTRILSIAEDRGYSLQNKATYVAVIGFHRN